MCKTCGVHAYIHLYSPPKEYIDSLPEQKKELLKKMLEVQAVNIGALDRMEWTDIKVARSDEGR